MRFVFWQQTNSPHQFALLDALSRYAGGHTVELVVTQPLPEERVRMGWQEPQYEHVTVHRQPSAALIDLLIRTQLQDSIHIFSGLAADHTGKVALDACIERGARVGLMAEAGNWSGPPLVKLARRAKYRLLGRKYAKHIDFLLPIGSKAPEWYLDAGFDGEKMYSFGYYVDHTTVPTFPVNHDQPVSFLFVARAIPIKGGDLLLKALGQVKGSWKAFLITEGDERSSWEALAQRLGLTDYLTFGNFESNDEIQRRMAHCDALVLPNTGKEGWGVVVNEALLQGAWVICTTETGASTLIADDRGSVVEPTCEALTEALQQAVDAGPRSPESRLTTSRWAQENISGAAAARRLVSVALAAQERMRTH